MKKFITTTIACLLITSSVYAGVPITSVTASSADRDNVATNTIDNDLNTRWSAVGEGENIVYMLESCGLIGSVSISWYKGNERKTLFDIDLSHDGAEWTNVFSGESSGTTLGMESYDFDDTDACFVRIVGFGNNVTKLKWTSINEVSINAGVPEEPATETVAIPLSLLREICAPLIP